MTSEFPSHSRWAAVEGRDLASRFALVVDGGSGIGKACATAPAGAVAHVVDRDAEAATAVAAEIGGGAHVADLAVRAAAKHALEGLSKVAAIEGAPHGGTSNCLHPGYVDTVDREADSRSGRHTWHQRRGRPERRTADPPALPSRASWKRTKPQWPQCGCARTTRVASPLPRCSWTAVGEPTAPVPHFTSHSRTHTRSR
ncbi:SDR family oxidoreductase [Streptomyces sp. NPDC014622]|uniref:SDR family oxidoreductase n=1 Tax=Streptomyces sp. NPDC014622 TaxID=3364874 RepID=UPI0037026EE9